MSENEETKWRLGIEETYPKGITITGLGRIKMIKKLK
jgi:hypothetical protein